jgi:hypothetical protein
MDLRGNLRQSCSLKSAVLGVTPPGQQISDTLKAAR